MTRRQSLQPHYVRTLDYWAAALQGNRDEAIEIPRGDGHSGSRAATEPDQDCYAPAMAGMAGMAGIPPERPGIPNDIPGICGSSGTWPLASCDSICGQ